MTELLSVIIPTYNAAQYLPAAITSVSQQQYPTYEIIVVDDGSTDNTQDVLKGLDVVVIRQANQGSAVARNTGLAAARGSLIAFLDADDIWATNKISKQVASINQNRQVGIVSGLIQITDMALQPIAEPMFMLSLCTLLVRRRVFDKLGFFDTNLAQGEDVDWLLRVFEANIPIEILSDVVLMYRRHDSNVTNDRQLANRFFLQALKRSLDRRRQSQQVLQLPEIPENARLPDAKDSNHAPAD